MNQVEFEMYRQQLDLKVKGVTSVKPKPEAATGDQVPIASGENGTYRDGVKRHDGGYGKGYGARMGPGNNSRGGGNHRGGSMSMGGGRNR